MVGRPGRSVFENWIIIRSMAHLCGKGLAENLARTVEHYNHITQYHIDFGAEMMTLGSAARHCAARWLVRPGVDNYY